MKKILYIRLDSSPLPEASDEIIVKDFNLENYFCSILGERLLTECAKTQTISYFGEVVSEIKKSLPKVYNDIIIQWESMLLDLLNSDNGRGLQLNLNIPSAYFNWLLHHNNAAYREIGNLQLINLSFNGEFLYEELIERILLKRLQFTISKITIDISYIVISFLSLDKNAKIVNYLKNINNKFDGLDIIDRQLFIEERRIMTKLSTSYEKKNVKFESIQNINDKLLDKDDIDSILELIEIVSGNNNTLTEQLIGIVRKRLFSWDYIIAQNTVEQKLGYALYKIGILRVIRDKIDIKDQIEHIIAICKNVFTDVDIQNDIRKATLLSELYCKFINKINILILTLVKCEDIKEEVSLLLTILAKFHGKEFYSLDQICQIDKKTESLYIDVPLLIRLSKLSDRMDDRHLIEKIILESYKTLICQRIESIFISSDFVTFKIEIINKYQNCLESIFSWQKIQTLYRTITDPFMIKYKIREIANIVLEKTAHEVSVDIAAFFSERLHKILHDLNNLVGCYSKIPYFVDNFLQSLNNLCMWCHMDISEISEIYANSIVERCSMFYYADIDENSNFFESCSEGYLSAFRSLLENITEDGRKLIKTDVFDGLKKMINNKLDYSIENSKNKLLVELVKKC
ncbi:MAG: hypothetical protein E7081_06900 [Bacteroidales bacterium]|nr:hypothetical protein [Bacteroidales bacterium]